MKNSKLKKEIASPNVAIANAPTDYAESVLTHSRQKLVEKLRVKEAKDNEEKLRIDHFQIGPDGHGALHFTGSPRKLAELSRWIIKNIPEKYGRLVDAIDNPGRDLQCMEYNKTHRHASMSVEAWVLMCNWWTPYSAPPLESNGN
jgi:hypothetical protein